MTDSKLTFNNGKSLTLKNNCILTCESKYCIYALKCKCGLFYIGECVNFRKRINLHVNQIKTKDYRKLYVSKHIFRCGSEFKTMPFFLMQNENIIDRKIYEQNFIQMFNPELNK